MTAERDWLISAMGKGTDIQRAFMSGFYCGVREGVDGIDRRWLCPVCHQEMRRMLRPFHLWIEWRTRTIVRRQRDGLLREIEEP